MNWMQTAVDSLKDQLRFAQSLMDSNEAAIAYVRQRSTAGQGAWEIALRELGMATK